MNKLIFILILLWSGVAVAAPRLNFSDIVSGPDTGIDDGVGSGAIVTIWGNRLGSTQGTSKVYFTDSVAQKREAAHVYYWKNADGLIPGGPSNLYSSHRMQEISFSIPDSATGAGTITVEVDSVESNSLPFTVRSGTVYYISDDGDNTSGDGSFASPWKSLGYYSSPPGVSAKAGVIPGDIIYSLGSEIIAQEAIRGKAGTADNPFAIISYPGYLYKVTSSLSTTSGIVNYYPYDSSYWVVSKAKVITEVSGISVGTGWRVIGNEITDTACANGEGGSITAPFGKGGATKSYGNYIHDFGCPSTTTKHHVFYISNRSKSVVTGSDSLKYACKVDHISSSETTPITGASWETYWELSTIPTTPPIWANSTNYKSGNIPGFDISWNRLEDNDARNGLHIYDEGLCGDIVTDINIANNLVRNQAGGAITIGSLFTYQVSPCLSTTVNVYNNIVHAPGSPPHTQPSYTTAGLQIYGVGFDGHVNAYNNTFIATPYNMETVGVCGSGYTAMWQYPGTWNYENNIVIDTLGARYEPVITNKTPISSTHNVWYNGSDGIPASPPAWDSGYITADPLLTDPTGGDFTLQSGSSAIGFGDVWAASEYDFYGVYRGADVFDAGALEYDSALSAPDPTCSDLTQNGDETGVDCGGSCPACSTPVPWKQSVFTFGSSPMEFVNE